jgi:hypothetical protein
MLTTKEIADLEAQTVTIKALNEGRKQQLEQCTQVLGGLLSSGNTAKKPQLSELSEINQIEPHHRDEKTLLQQSDWVSDPDGRRRAKEAAK